MVLSCSTGRPEPSPSSGHINMAVLSRPCRLLTRSQGCREAPRGLGAAPEEVLTPLGGGQWSWAMRLCQPLQSGVPVKVFSMDWLWDHLAFRNAHVRPHVLQLIKLAGLSVEPVEFRFNA